MKPNIPSATILVFIHGIVSNAGLQSNPVASSSANGPVLEDTSVTLYCVFGDFGLPWTTVTVTWLKDGMVYRNNEQNLTLPHVAVDDHDGSWACKVTNVATPGDGLVSNAVTLTVNEWPSNLVASSSAIGPVLEGTSVMLYCVFGDFGKPPATVTVTWLKDGMVYRNNEQNLTLPHVSVDDHDGSWACKVTNDATPGDGLVSNAIILSVNANPSASSTAISIGIPIAAVDLLMVGIIIIVIIRKRRGKYSTSRTHVAVYENSTIGDNDVIAGASANTPSPTFQTRSHYGKLNVSESPAHQQLRIHDRNPNEQPAREYVAKSVRPLKVYTSDLDLGDVIHHRNNISWTMATYKGINVLLKRNIAERPIQFDDCLAAELRALRFSGSNDNIVPLIGTTSIGGRDGLIFPQFHEDLHEYLTRMKMSSDYIKLYDILPEEKLRVIAMGVARGMAYLHSKQPTLVHPCLRTHKILLDHNQVCKIRGFLAKPDVHSYLRTQKELDELPVRWLAPEVLRDVDDLADNSDVWSYGVLVWELCTLGKVPYEGISGVDITRYVGQGQLLSKPATCDDEIFDIMLKCWMRTPQNRPDFTTLVELLENR